MSSQMSLNIYSLRPALMAEKLICRKEEHMAATNTAQKRLRILGEDEVKDLYERPRFTHEDRIQYFSLSPSEKAALDQLHSIKSRIYFILQSAYFKARHMFFIFNFRDVEADFEYLRCYADQANFTGCLATYQFLWTI